MSRSGITQPQFGHLLAEVRLPGTLLPEGNTLLSRRDTAAPFSAFPACMCHLSHCNNPPKWRASHKHYSKAGWAPHHVAKERHGEFLFFLFLEWCHHRVLFLRSCSRCCCCFKTVSLMMTKDLQIRQGWMANKPPTPPHPTPPAPRVACACSCSIGLYKHMPPCPPLLLGLFCLHGF